MSSSPWTRTLSVKPIRQCNADESHSAGHNQGACDYQEVSDTSGNGGSRNAGQQVHRTRTQVRKPVSSGSFPWTNCTDVESLPNLAVLDQGDGAPRRRSRPLRHALRACGVGAGPSGRADRAAQRSEDPRAAAHHQDPPPAPSTPTPTALS
jgi:hypothetical protein